MKSKEKIIERILFARERIENIEKELKVEDMPGMIKSMIATVYSYEEEIEVLEWVLSD